MEDFRVEIRLAEGPKAQTVTTQMRKKTPTMMMKMTTLTTIPTTMMTRNQMIQALQMMILLMTIGKKLKHQKNPNQKVLLSGSDS